MFAKLISHLKKVDTGIYVAGIYVIMITVLILIDRWLMGVIDNLNKVEGDADLGCFEKDWQTGKTRWKKLKHSYPYCEEQQKKVLRAQSGLVLLATFGLSLSILGGFFGATMLWYGPETGNRIRNFKIYAATTLVLLGLLIHHIIKYYFVKKEDRGFSFITVQSGVGKTMITLFLSFLVILSLGASVLRKFEPSESK